MNKQTIGIALSGGGARGIAHIGVLKALEEHGIYPTNVAGTSMGAIVGVLYAAGFSANEMARVLKDEKVYKWFKVEWFKPGLLSLSGVKDLLSKQVGHNEFGKLKRPFSVVVSNLNTGKGEIISRGDMLMEWVIASACVPIVFTPMVINGFTYVDGGLFHNLPTEALIGESNYIIGSNVNPVSRVEEVESAKQVGERVFNLSIAQNVWQSRNYCDFFIEAKDIVKYATWDYFKVDELIEVGYNAANKIIDKYILPELKEAGVIGKKLSM
ncbi:patatin-like phospholipase family protein [Saccharicrinis fermentans]|uniref:NTE family protein RssA n=1 Tax=Saccharicrinis fermentans DSM 9555 = JCM 21142 TaxID=869213 RepID=W7Y1F1_9BACT|nr:patatin-like phospholipase family protein [Saccharicrinis fermentans]GAF04735.1 NTE family protein RssA [Saccharicrinis fermentans DSM 9555 = JCM 21142]